MKISPEHWVDKFVRSATNGRSVSVRLRRILTIIAIPIWVTGLIWALVNTFVGESIFDYYKYKGNSTYEKERLAYNGMIQLLSFPIYIFFFFIVPWIIIRLTFWVIDADKVEEV